MNYTVTAHVAGHGLHKGRPKTELEIPAMRSKHPLILYNMKPEDQQMLPLGEDVDVVLEAQRVKPPREGQAPLDPTKSWNWFWNFVRVATPEDGQPVDPVVLGAVTQPQQAPEAATGAPAPAAATGRERRGGGGADPVGTSIMAQVALKAAVDSLPHVDGAKTGMGVDEVVLEMATKYHHWLLKASAHGINGIPEAPETPRNGNGVQVHQEGPKDQREAPQGAAPVEDLPNDDPRDSVRGAQPKEEQPPLDTYENQAPPNGEWSDDVPGEAEELPPGVVDHYGDAQPRELEATAHKFDERDGKIPLTSDGTTPEWGCVTEDQAFKGDIVIIGTRSGKTWRGRVHSPVREVNWKGVRKWISTYDRLGD